MYINSTNIPPIVIINRIYETQNLLSLYLVSFLVGLRTYQHPCTLMPGKFFKAFMKITSNWQHARWNVNNSKRKFPFPATISADKCYFDPLCHTAALETNMLSMFHSVWNRKCPERQLDTIIQRTVLLSTDNPQFKMVEAEIPTKASVHLDCFVRDCFRHLALLTVSMWIICTWEESDDRIPNYRKSCTWCLRGSTHQNGRCRRDCTKYNYSHASLNDGDTFWEMRR
jgi:hypothetical protein